MKKEFVRESYKYVNKVNTNSKILEYFYSTFYQNLYLLNRNKS